MVGQPTRPPALRWILLAIAALACALGAASASALDINSEVTLQDGEVGQPYAFQFTGDEGCQPYHFTLKQGTLPAGLTLHDDGKLDGTPTEAGTFEFWVELSDGEPGGACHSRVPSQGEFHVFIAPKIEITTSLPTAKAGVPYKATVAAKGGGSLEWSVVAGSLPPGLSLNKNDGTLAGTPSAAGTFAFTVKVNDAKRKATQDFSFVVAAPLAVASTVTAPPAEVGVPATVALASTGGIGPVVWSAPTGVPAGLALDPAKGTIAGVPTAAGRFSIAVTATDSDGQAVQTAVALVVAPRVTVATLRLGPAKVGRRYRATLLARGGVSPRTWRLVGGKLPRGLSLDRRGVIAGSPRGTGTFRLTVAVADRLHAVARRAISLRVTS